MALLGPPRGPVLAQKGPFGGPGGPWAALGRLIWAQVPLVGPTGQLGGLHSYHVLGPYNRPLQHSRGTTA